MRGQRRNSRRWTIAIGFAPVWAGLVALPGCTRKAEPMPPEVPVAEAEPEVPEGDYRAESLDGLVASLEEKAARLPGRIADDHRRQMHEVFVDVVQILPILEGPEPSGAFRQQLRTVTVARDRLDPQAGRLSPEPVVDTGLRATHSALTSIGRDEPYAGQTMEGLLGKLGAKVDDLDNVRSVGRPYVAADAVRLIAGVVRQMADRVAGRATDTPSTGPTEPPLFPPGAIDPPRTPTRDPAAPGTTEAPEEAGEAPAEESPEEEMPTEEAPPADDAPADDAPADDAPAEEPPADDAPTEETPSEDMPAEEAPAEDAPSEDMPAEEAPAEDAPSEDMPAEESPAEDAPSEDMPADEAPTEETPSEEVPADAGPDGETPEPDVAPVETDAPTGESPEVAKPPQAEPSTEEPADEAPGGEPATETPTPAEDGAAEEAPADAASSDSPEAETPAEEEARAAQAQGDGDESGPEDQNK